MSESITTSTNQRTDFNTFIPLHQQKPNKKVLKNYE